MQRQRIFRNAGADSLRGAISWLSYARIPIRRFTVLLHGVFLYVFCANHM
jgi:hypothetical protein